MKYNVFCLAVVVLFLTSCVNKVSSIKQDIDLKLEADMGYLLMGVDSNVSMKDVDIVGQSNIRLSSEDLRPGTQYILIDLQAGDYQFESIKLNSIFEVELVEGYWNFNVRPSGISYIGHLDVKADTFFLHQFTRTNVELTNRSSEALQFMETEFPNILSKRTMYYEGPGKDPFLRFMQEENINE
ncbi:MAG: hypothetical protein ABJV04_03320 [Aliiglaciecola sp.]|uniref:hypothetical protein n=1 Tax=Aliiglaciecola sp. TaxID=1872441 RepID=UPI003297885A